MKLAGIIGRVTLSVQEPSYRGGRFLLAMPLSKEQLLGAPLVPPAKGNSIVVWDELGAGVGDIIGFTDGGEAAAPFKQPTPVDAYCTAIIDHFNYSPPGVDKVAHGPVALEA